MRLTIAYLTFRKNPRFAWFASSLARELRANDLGPQDVQVVVVDGRLWYDAARKDEIAAQWWKAMSSLGAFSLEHVPPMPNVWQGPHRLTQQDFFAAANARNTALALARAPHVAFVDDLSVLLPNWLACHLKAQVHGYVLCGTTCKVNNLVVSDAGDIVSFDRFEPGMDSRLARLYDAAEVINCSGSWVFGGTFSVPLEAALRVNGQDSIHDSIGGEDYDFGVRLERIGTSIRITRACGTYELESGHHEEAPMVRLDKPWSGEDGPYGSNVLLNKLLRERDRTWTVGNEYNLRELRDRVLGGAPFPPPSGPTTYWMDGEPLGRLGAPAPTGGDCSAGHTLSAIGFCQVCGMDGRQVGPEAQSTSEVVPDGVPE